jgi:hypothetical protein
MQFPTTNLLLALINLKNANYPNLQSFVVHGNRINAVGDSLEYFVKDMFANTFSIDDVDKKAVEYRKLFSWLGNQKNPPDFIVKLGDAIEVKKHTGEDSDIALNSSPPKDYLYMDDPRIAKACRECEGNNPAWQKKDLAYFVGTTDEDKLLSLWIVYGNCYAADRGIYGNVNRGLVAGIVNIPDVEFAPTKELGRVNKVDPLGITDLRIRGMWHIQSPNKVYSRIKTGYSVPSLHAILLKSKFQELQAACGSKVINELNGAYTVKDVAIADPNNPARQLEAVYISAALQAQSELR